MGMASEVDFYQIVYREEQKSACFPFAKVHFNDTLTPFFENSVIADLVLASTAEKVSVCSWKLREKLRWNVRRPRPLTEEVLKTNYEVMSFTGNSKNHEAMAAADKWHPGFRVTVEKLLRIIGKSCPSELKYPIYQNHFIAKADIYKRYVKEYLKPLMEVMKDDPDCWKDSGYTQLNKIDAASGEYLKERIGVSYYPMHPFILERMISIFCQNEGIKVTYL
jgi:hypothetical protein